MVCMKDQIKQAQGVQQDLSATSTMSEGSCLNTKTSQENMEKMISKLANQMKFIKESRNEINKTDYTRNGKQKLPFKVYEQSSLKRIAELNFQMSKLPKTSPEWLRLKKQCLSQKTRLRNRSKELFRQDDKVITTQKLIQAIIDLSLEKISAHKH